MSKIAKKAICFTLYGEELKSAVENCHEFIRTVLRALSAQAGGGDARTVQPV